MHKLIAVYEKFNRGNNAKSALLRMRRFKRFLHMLMKALLLRPLPHSFLRLPVVFCRWSPLLLLQLRQQSVFDFLSGLMLFLPNRNWNPRKVNYSLATVVDKEAAG